MSITATQDNDDDLIHESCDSNNLVILSGPPTNNNSEDISSETHITDSGTSDKSVSLKGPDKINDESTFTSYSIEELFRMGKMLYLIVITQLKLNKN